MCEDAATFRHVYIHTLAYGAVFTATDYDKFVPLYKARNDKEWHSQVVIQIFTSQRV